MKYTFLLFWMANFFWLEAGCDDSSGLDVQSTKSHARVWVCKGRPSHRVTSTFRSVSVAIWSLRKSFLLLAYPPLLLAGKGVYSVVAGAAAVILCWHQNPAPLASQHWLKIRSVICTLLVANDMESLLLSLFAVCFNSSWNVCWSFCFSVGWFRLWFFF